MLVHIYGTLLFIFSGTPWSYNGHEGKNTGIYFVF